MMFSRLGAFPYYKQLDQMDCGPTCLRMIFKYYGKDISITELREKSQVSQAGASLLTLQEAAEHFGFQGVGAKLTFDQLISEIPLPCIAHWGGRHFIVIMPGSTPGKVRVADPAKGVATFTSAEFVSHWRLQSDTYTTDIGIALILTPTPSFYQIEETGSSVSWLSLLTHFLRFKWYFFQLSLGLLLGSLLQLILPFLTQSIS